MYLARILGLVACASALAVGGRSWEAEQPQGLSARGGLKAKDRYQMNQGRVDPSLPGRVSRLAAQVSKSMGEDAGDVSNYRRVDWRVKKPGGGSYVDLDTFYFVGGKRPGVVVTAAWNGQYDPKGGPDERRSALQLLTHSATQVKRQLGLNDIESINDVRWVVVDKSTQTDGEAVQRAIQTMAQARKVADFDGGSYAEVSPSDPAFGWLTIPPQGGQTFGGALGTFSQGLAAKTSVGSVKKAYVWSNGAVNDVLFYFNG